MPDRTLRAVIPRHLIGSSATGLAVPLSAPNFALNNPRNSRPHASAVVASFPRVQSSAYASSAHQALNEDLRQAENEVAHGGETSNDVPISELTVYFTVGVGSGRLSISWWPGAESNHRHADFNSGIGRSRGF